MWLCDEEPKVVNEMLDVHDSSVVELLVVVHFVNIGFIFYINK